MINKTLISMAFMTLLSIAYAETGVSTSAIEQAPLKKTTTHTPEAKHWGYVGETAPEHWADLGKQFALCHSGENQSPINIVSDFDVDLPALALEYQGQAVKVVNNGHTIQVNITKGRDLMIDGQPFTLKQFHFHTPSENTINGKHFPLEAHFVHRNEKTNHYAVIAVMFEEGDNNPLLEQIWQNMPTEKGKKEALKTLLDYAKLLPDDKDYYRFNGSFTTPPCTEGVRWYVLKEPMNVAKTQVDTFLSVMKHPNNRPLQDLYARVIVK